MCYNTNTRLWESAEENFFREKMIVPQLQIGGTCVSTALSMLTGVTPEDIRTVGINTQNPVSWSLALIPYGMKLAYCPVDVRRLKFYMEELIGYDDLFLLCYYSLNDPSETILNDPDNMGWIVGSHVVILQRDQIIDSSIGAIIQARQHDCNNAYTKRLFRVVPKDHKRGL